MTRASELKKADVVDMDGRLLIVREIAVQNPSARGAATLYKVRFSDVQTRLRHQESFKGDDILKLVDLERRPVSYSYVEGDDHVFMDDEDFNQYTFKEADIADDLPFLPPDIKGCRVLLVDGEPIGLELPAVVEMDIVETPPALKGASATSRTKPATFATGLVVQVPEYLEAGERVKIHTQECRYTGRAE